MKRVPRGTRVKIVGGQLGTVVEHCKCGSSLCSTHTIELDDDGSCHVLLHRLDFHLLTPLEELADAAR